MNYSEKLNEIGLQAKVLVELHLEKPKEFNAETVLNELINVYEKLELDSERKI
jgi:hypothetical protein